ncbi:hypothetical protein HD554DRAFT_2098562, partial [Boletus coccyginus]
MSQLFSMQHALAVLELNDLWNWPNTKRIPVQGGKLHAAIPKFLYFLIVESQRLGVESLKEEDFVSAQRSLEVLFRGLDHKNVNSQPVLDMAVEFFTHLGIACERLTIINMAVMNPGGRKSGTSTEFSVNDVVDEETDKLLQRVNEGGQFGKRKQESLKAL